MMSIMDKVRNQIASIGKYKIVNKIDYEKGVNGLPKSNVLKLFLDNGTSIVVRPSGTEPKLKIYTSICGDNFENNDKTYQEHINDVKVLLK